MDGKYQIDGLIPGQYTVQYIPTSNPIFTVPSIGMYNKVLTSGQILTDVDFGVVQRGSLHGVVYLDKNADGAQQQDELLLSSIEMVLEGQTFNGVPINLTSTTLSDGKFEWTDLIPGVYSIRVNNVLGYVISQPVSGAYNNINLNSGSVLSDVDFGLYQLASIGDRVWEDINGNGIQDTGERGLSGINIQLKGVSTQNNVIVQSARTDANGQFLISGLIPGRYEAEIILSDGYVLTPAKRGMSFEKDSDFDELTRLSQFDLMSGEVKMDIDAGLFLYGQIGDLVWEDLNCDGIRQINEPGVGDVSVRLEGFNHLGTVIDTFTRSNSQGFYVFDKLRPGDYRISVVPLSGYEFSAAMMSFMTIESGTIIDDADAPLFRRAFLGDRVWDDVNQNGLQDTGEQGIEGVKVTLRDTKQNGVLDVETVTNDQGNYQFSQIKPGTYNIVFEWPDQYTSTAPLQGNNSQIDSDINEDGITQVGKLIWI